MIRVRKPGLLSTIQDLGRVGYQKYGVIASGAMDSLSHRMANLLVGNDESLATLELTLIGPTLEFLEDTLISICGGNLTPSVEGRLLPMYRPVLVKKGSILTFGVSQNGSRAYLAVAGGFSVTQVMGSYSTYIMAGIGGFRGRPIQANDQLKIASPSQLSSHYIHLLSKGWKDSPIITPSWFVRPWIKCPSSNVLRVIEGKQVDWFTTETKVHFFSDSFNVTRQSDRMGYRLLGHRLSSNKTKEMLSEAVTFGTIQVPSDGNPIILGADRQTTGGYPKIAQVISVDLPCLAQLKPGDSIRFKKVSLLEAQTLLINREKWVRELKQGIYMKWKKGE
ncbi:biotin-dependent carboxyltransferase family protein [Cytobacillus spongiae]|uniref:5-oxoprolinase subunit C family protein n=1 Tax=Cytobacillus spongiae TaxID=2901381 RepID=UPI0025464FAE|nr:biotin-dependent carboxyltransferase family protein [Cytobacillus spongiae]